ncbi:MAG: rod shape-determining protein MreC [Gemmatimonadales bacterium]|nr:rod shape-determining protein MreC [Gemmatimonadales bacterium]
MGRSLSFSSRADVLALAVCIMLALGLLSLPEDTKIFVADRLGLVLTSPYWEVKNFGQDVIRTKDENAWLQQRVAELELLSAATERMQRDMGRMAGPALDAGYDGELVPCQVMVRQRGRFATMIKIRSLVPVEWLPWQPVITNSGYLGRLSSVINEREAWVELLIAPDFAVGVEIERSGLLGVLRPRANRFELEMIGRDEDVRPGDRVITSGIAEIRDTKNDPEGHSLTPRGFPVGTVLDVDTPAENIFKRILVAPAAAFDFNQTVFVVTPLTGVRRTGESRQ